MMQRTLPTFALALAVLGAAACSDPVGNPSVSPSERPSLIVNGTPTGSAFASVGALMFDFDGNGLSGDDEWCSGALISPTVFLTAAHCVISSFTPPGTQFYVSFAPDLYASGATFIQATGYAFDPAYGHDRANLHDYAVVFLPAGSTQGLTPYRLPTRLELDELAAQGGLRGAIFLNVGYGTSASRTGPPSFTYDGVRKVSESVFMALTPEWLGLLMNTRATGLGGDCYGDSGGPKFLQSNPGVVYATVTTGDLPCRATTWDPRTDTDDFRAFVSQYVTPP